MAKNWTERQLNVNGLSMHVVEQGQGPAVVLCHGLPELWFSWRHQIPALAEAGFRVIVPDQLASASGSWMQPALKAIDEIMRESVTDPVGPEFMAPPARSAQKPGE